MLLILYERITGDLVMAKVIFCNMETTKHGTNYRHICKRCGKRHVNGNPTYYTPCKIQDTSNDIEPAPPKPVLPKIPPVELQALDGPNILAKAVHFTQAIMRHVAGGMNLCSEEQIQKRSEICFGCEFFRKNPDGESGVCAHLGCGCNINLRPEMLNKLAMPTEKCPMDKWGPELPIEPTNDGV